MKLIIGLGNPGEKYKNNRHNVGHRFAEFLISNSKFLNNFKIFKTDAFMNESGTFVKKHLSNLTNLSNLYIVHDDLDLPLGQYKIQLGVGPKIHYGVNSVEEALGDKNFWRVRIGVDNRQQATGSRRTPGEEYVLQDFSSEELEILKGVFDEIQRKLLIPN